MEGWFMCIHMGGFHGLLTLLCRTCHLGVGVEISWAFCIGRVDPDAMASEDFWGDFFSKKDQHME